MGILDKIGSGLKSLGSSSLGFATGGLLGDERFGYLDNIVGGSAGGAIEDYFMADTKAARAQQGAARQASDIVDRGYINAQDLYMGNVRRGKEDIIDFRSNVKGGQYDTDAITSEWQGFQRGQGPEYQGFDPGQAPSFQGYDRGAGPGINMFQRGAGPSINMFQRGQGPQYEGFQRGQGPEISRFERGQGPEFTRTEGGEFDFEESPGYQFRLSEGIKARERAGAARGNRLSGAALKELEGFGQGLASEEYGRSFDRFQTDRGFREREAGRETGFDVDRYRFGTSQDFASQQSEQGARRGAYEFGTGMDSQEQARRNQALERAYQFGTGTDLSSLGQFQNLGQQAYQFGTGTDQSSLNQFQNLGQQNYQFGVGQDVNQQAMANQFGQQNYQFGANLAQNQNQFQNQFGQQNYQFGTGVDQSAMQNQNIGNLSTNLQNYNMFNQQNQQAYSRDLGLANVGSENIANLSNIYTGGAEARANAMNNLGATSANRALAIKRTAEPFINLAGQAGAAYLGAG